ncbi:MAG: motility associated factor glycosyltransferase family protein [bacterium]|jgi:hypothetical protein
MNHFSSNLELLRKVSPNLADLCAEKAEADSQSNSSGWAASVVSSKTGLPVIELSHGERRIALSSRYDPVREAERTAAKHAESIGERNYVAVLGMGMGWHVDALIPHLSRGTVLVIVEPSLDVFRLAMKSRDLSAILTYPKVSLAAGCDPALFNQACLKYFQIMNFKGIYVVDCDYYRDTPYWEVMEGHRAKLRALMLQLAGNLQTMMAMGGSYSVNSLINLKYMMRDAVFKNLVGEFAGVPGVVVSAGPSLAKNAHLLEGLKDRAVICAVDTAVKPLLKMGITPDIVTTGDPQEANYRHLAGVKLPETYLIYDPQAPVKTVAEWKGRRFSCSFGTRFFNWFSQRIDVGNVTVWGSVATIAYDIVLQLGCDPIIFIGQDLSFTGGRTYVPGTYFEDDDKKTMTVEAERARNTRLIACKDINGEEVFTNRQMFAYCDFLLNRFLEPHGRRIVNATEGGILHGNGIEITTFAGAIEKYCTSHHGVRARLDAAYAKGNGFRLGYLLREMDRLIGELRRMIRAGRKGYALSNKLSALLETEDHDKALVRDIYNRMVRLRKEIDSLAEAKPFIEMVNQSGLYLYFTRLRDMVLDERGVDKDAMLKMNEAFNALFSTCLATSAQLLPLFESAREDMNALYESRDAHGAELAAAAAGAN